MKSNIVRLFYHSTLSFIHTMRVDKSVILELVLWVCLARTKPDWSDEYEKICE
jgi:hypothetical protein